MDQITVVHQFADQGIDLTQTQGGLRTTLKVATHETIFVHAHLEGCRASFIDGRGAILFGERKNAQDAPHTHFALLAIDKVAKCTDMGAHSAGTAMLRYLQSWIDQLRWQRLKPMEKLPRLMLNQLEGILHHCTIKVPI